MDKTEVFAKLESVGLDVETAQKMPLIGPGDDEPHHDKDGVEAHFLLLSEDSGSGRSFSRRYQQTIMQKVRRSGLKKAQAEEDPAEFEADKVCALIRGWHLVAASGEVLDLPCTPENVKALLLHPDYPWMRRDAAAFVANAANFRRASSQT